MEDKIEILDGIEERIEADGFESLTAPELHYFAVWWLEAETSNGAFHQYFSNSSGELAHEALEGLKAVGAAQMAAYFQQAINLFPNGQVPKDREERSRLLDDFSPASEEKLHQYSNAFSDYPDDLRTLLQAYVTAHERQFLGPKTPLALWHARHTRGAETRPRSISNWDLDKEAAADALATDRKCPMCGQPAPTYRKTCKRCGYPYGRAGNGSGADGGGGTAS